MIIAIILDRITQSLARDKKRTTLQEKGIKGRWKGILAILIILSMVGAALAQHQGAEKQTVTLTYVNWESEVASTYVLKHVLEDEGFRVELKEVDAGPMFAAVASGDADGTTAAWLPATHKDYMEEYQGSGG